jgi:photosystem II stability/assembly factor-like uncharacterized protein
VSGDYDGSYFGVRVLSDRSVLIHGLRGHAFLSRNDGLNWHPLPTGVDSTLMGSVAADDGSILILGHAGVIVRYRPGAPVLTRLPGRDLSAHHGGVLLAANRLLLAGSNGIHVLDLAQDGAR